jgi:hypothetical protein
VSCVRNAIDFLQEYRQLRHAYNKRFHPLIKSIRADYVNGPTGSVPKPVDETLEAHVREYFVNTFLRALNWRLDKDVEDGLPNLIPEVPITSANTGRTKFLDYLGTEGATNVPFL